MDDPMLKEIDTMIGYMKRRMASGQGRAHDAMCRLPLADAKYLRTELATLHARCKDAAHVLIEEIGAPGPEDVGETATRAAAIIATLRAERADFAAENAALRERVTELEGALKAQRSISKGTLRCLRDLQEHAAAVESTFLEEVARLRGLLGELDAAFAEFGYAVLHPDLARRVREEVE